MKLALLLLLSNLFADMEKLDQEIKQNIKQIKSYEIMQGSSEEFANGIDKMLEKSIKEMEAKRAAKKKFKQERKK
jgi:hypothetical protein